MATRNTCDRCGNDIDPTVAQNNATGEAWYTLQGSDGTQQHLCSPACLLAGCMIVVQQQKVVAQQRIADLQAATAAAEEQQRLAEDAIETTMPRPVNG